MTRLFIVITCAILFAAQVVSAANNWARFKIDLFPNNYNDQIYYDVLVNGNEKHKWSEQVKMYADGTKSCNNGLCVTTYFEKGYIDFSYGGKGASHPNQWRRVMECSFWNPKSEKCLMKRTSWQMDTKEVPIE